MHPFLRGGLEQWLTEVPRSTAEGLVTGLGPYGLCPAWRAVEMAAKRSSLQPPARLPGGEHSLPPVSPHRRLKLPPGRADLTAAPGSSAGVTESHGTLRGQGNIPLLWATGEPRSFAERPNNYSLHAPCPFQRPFLLFCLFADFLKVPFSYVSHYTSFQ